MTRALPLTPDQETELTDIVYNTMDFCGSVNNAVKEYLKENNLQYNQDIEAFLFKLQDNYFKHGIN